MADIDTFFKAFNILECFQVFPMDFLVNFYCNCGNIWTTVRSFTELLAFFATGMIIATSLRKKNCYIYSMILRFEDFDDFNLITKSLF